MTDPALVLIGPMGAGKTSIGRRAAKILGERFVDTDKVVVRDHGPIPDLFRTAGEEHFRALERAAVVESLGGGGVIALGGGAILHPDTRADLAAHRVVLLTVTPRTIAQRLRRGGRPLLEGDEDPIARWERIWAERRPVYESLAGLTVDTSSRPVSRLAEEIAAWASGPADRTEESA